MLEGEAGSKSGTVWFGWKVRLGEHHSRTGQNMSHKCFPKPVLNIIVLFVYGNIQHMVTRPVFIPMTPNLGLFSSGSGYSTLINVSHSLVNLQALEIIQSNEEN